MSLGHTCAHVPPVLVSSRCISHAHNRTAQGNYSLNGLVGFEMYNKTVGVVGTGAIGYEAIRILKVGQHLRLVGISCARQFHAPACR